ncbi:MAG: mandelate racemase [Actinobacteria bacterium]|nr:mandelate racemase [Actinomycetota bacterium]
MASAVRTDVAVERLDVSAYTIPTDGPESDGTFEWDSTTIVVVEAHAGDEVGLGYTYADAAAGKLVESKLADVVGGRDALAPRETWTAMGEALRNVGRPGVGFMALSAVDSALWDLRARLLDVPLVDAIGRAHDCVPIYGSGGFCSYSLERLADQLAGWVEQGIPRVKMKVSREPDEDVERMNVVRDEIGDEPELYVDSNGALSRKQALYWLDRFAGEWGVTWHEEPVSSADLDGLHLCCERGPEGLDIAAGEYAFVPRDFLNLLEVRAVDCLQADVTRAGGITGVLAAGALADGFGIDLSGHCAPQLSAHALCGVTRLRHLEYFHDHVRIESMLFDGVLEPQEGGVLRPDRTRAGHGLELKRQEAERWSV